VEEEFVAPAEHGRVFRGERRIHLGDCGSDARMRLGALARFLQDVATDDADDSGLDQYRGVWVVRRMAIAWRGVPRYHDRVALATFCSGTGPCWAERRTTMTAGDRVLAECAAIWVYLDGAGGRPQPLEPDFFAIYGSAARQRRVRGRLRHPRPAPGLPSRPWPLRDGDFDVLDHVNNARSFEAVEDELVARLGSHRVDAVTVEFRGALDRGDDVELVSEVRPSEGPSHEVTTWLTVGGEVRVSAVAVARTRD
jgi:acyl-ACP thioesterase